MSKIVLTDAPPLPKDERCPQCGAGREARIVSPTFGKPHDLCSMCAYDFDELTVHEEQEWR